MLGWANSYSKSMVSRNLIQAVRIIEDFSYQDGNFPSTLLAMCPDKVNTVTLYVILLRKGRRRRKKKKKNPILLRCNSSYCCRYVEIV